MPMFTLSFFFFKTFNFCNHVVMIFLVNLMFISNSFMKEETKKNKFHLFNETLKKIKLKRFISDQDKKNKK